MHNFFERRVAPIGDIPLRGGLGTERSGIQLIVWRGVEGIRCRIMRDLRLDQEATEVGCHVRIDIHWNAVSTSLFRISTTETRRWWVTWVKCWWDGEPVACMKSHISFDYRRLEQTRGESFVSGGSF